MKSYTVGLAAAFGLMVLAAPSVVGHHSFDVQFYSQKTRNLTGVITKVDWINPHAYLHLNVVDESGAVTDTRVLRSHGVLDQAAIDAVKQWRYEPLRLNGKAEPFILSVTVSFSLAR